MDRSRVVFASCSLRTYSGRNLTNDGQGEQKVEKERPAKKQLKTEDLLRILSLAKPEYKNIAGKF